MSLLDAYHDKHGYSAHCIRDTVSFMPTCDCGTHDYRHDYGCNGWRDRHGRDQADHAGGPYVYEHSDLYHPDGTALPAAEKTRRMRAREQETRNAIR